MHRQKETAREKRRKLCVRGRQNCPTQIQRENKRRIQLYDIERTD